MENLYNYIEETAKKHGYKNITEYCKATGIPRATMSELKAGRTKKLSAKTAQVIFSTLQIPLNTLLGIETADGASELNTTPEYLTGETDDPEIKKSPTLSSEGELDAELNYIWNNIDDTDREFLLASARLLMERRNKK